MVVIPAETARRLGLEPGGPVEVEELEDAILVRPVRTLHDLMARWGPLGPPVTGAEIARTLREEREAH